MAAVMTLFRPGPAVLRGLAAVRDQVALVVLVDDTGAPADTSPVLPLAEEADDVLLLVNRENQGLAAALNRGCERAFAEGMRAVVTLDQDTVLPPGFVAELVAGLGTDVDGGAPAGRAACAAGTVNGVTPVALHHHGPDLCSLAVVQSGLLVSRDAFESVGGFAEDLFIDGLEVDFVARLHRVGRHVALVPGLDLEHAIGAPTVHRIAGRSVLFSNHAPTRVYYYFRNHVHLVLRLGRRETRWRLSCAASLVRQVVKLALYSGARRVTIGMAWRGLRDGVRRRLGPIEVRGATGLPGERPGDGPTG